MKTIQIQEIHFSNTSSTVTCKGNLRHGNLSIQSSVQIDFSQLNLLLNKICGILGSDELYSRIVESVTPEGSFYFIQLPEGTFTELSLEDFSQGMKHPFRICA
jgi:hypothetical protein